MANIIISNINLFIVIFMYTHFGFWSVINTMTTTNYMQIVVLVDVSTNFQNKYGHINSENVQCQM